MNEDFNLDDRHEVDDLFRNGLEDYSEIPSDAAWSRMSRKLNRKEVIDFVTFSKTKVSPAQAALVPIYRRQWFRAAAVSAIVVPALFFAGYFLAKNAQNPQLTQNNSELIQTPDALTGPNHIASLNTPDALRPAFNSTVSGQQANNNNNNSNAFVPTKDQSKQTHNQGKNNTVPANNNNNNQVPVTQSQSMSVDNIQDLINDPVIINNLKALQEVINRDSARYQAARIVDSIIQANATENQVLQSNDPQNNTTVDPDNHVTSDPDNPVVVNNDPIIIIPKAFTPNADGLNDLLYIDGLEYYPDNTFVVYDVKGKVVYSKKEYRGDWNAEGVPDGLYFYFLTYKNKQRVNITIKGVVTIIR